MKETANRSEREKILSLRAKEYLAWLEKAFQEISEIRRRYRESKGK